MWCCFFTFLKFWTFWTFHFGAEEPGSGLRNQALEAQGTRGGHNPQGTRGADRLTQVTVALGYSKNPL